MEMTKNRQAAEMVSKAIDALVDAITDGVKKITDNGEREVMISADEEWLAYIEDDKVMLESEWEDKYPISSIKIDTLIGINNAIVTGNYD